MASSRSPRREPSSNQRRSPPSGACRCTRTPPEAASEQQHEQKTALCAIPLQNGLIRRRTFILYRPSRTLYVRRSRCSALLDAFYASSALHSGPSHPNRSSSSTCCFSSRHFTRIKYCSGMLSGPGAASAARFAFAEDLHVHLHVGVEVAAQVAVEQLQPAVGQLVRQQAAGGGVHSRDDNLAEKRVPRAACVGLAHLCIQRHVCCH